MDTAAVPTEPTLKLFKHELSYSPPQVLNCYLCSRPSTDSLFIFCPACEKNYHRECVFAREEDLTPEYRCPSCLRNKTHRNSDTPYSPTNSSDHVVPLTALSNGITNHEDTNSSSCDGCNNGLSSAVPSHKRYTAETEYLEAGTNGADLSHIYTQEYAGGNEFNSNGQEDDVNISSADIKSNLLIKPKKVKTQSLFDETYAYLEGCERRKRNRDTLTKGDRFPNGSGVHGPEDNSLQCLGPACTNAARDNSKYCCEECGIQLATDRIKQHLPQRLEEWRLGGACLAERRDRQRLGEVERELTDVRNRLQQLDLEGQRLNQLISRVSKLPVSYNKERFDNESEDLMLDCPTCGIQFTMKKIQVHMEKCWAKLESGMTLSSYVKLEGANFFCDKYDKKYNTYCKKLKVMCPEHTKEAKVGANDVCGCPLVENLSILPPNSPSVRFCQLTKRTCRKHPFWEKMRRATIDQERLIQWLKLDELDEQRKLLRGQLSTRGSLIALLLHRTVPANAPISIDS